MQKKFIACALLYGVLLSATFSHANPLLGTWEWVNVKNSCREEYIFGSEGSGYITSGEEISTASYTISPQADANGYYGVQLHIIEDKGGKDCGESLENNSGETYQKYLMFHPSGNLYVSCDSADTRSCVGPFKRVH